MAKSTKKASAKPRAKSVKQPPAVTTPLDEVLAENKRRALIIAGALTSISTGQSLRSFCRANELPYRTVWDWLNEDDAAQSAYARAREVGTHYLADECLDISDNVMAEAERHLKETLKTVTEYAGVDPALLDALGVRPPEIGDLIKIARGKIDTRLRLIGKWNRRDYGDKVDGDQTVKHEVGDELAAWLDQRG